MAQVYSFGPFQLDERERALRRDGTPVSLTPKAFDVLALLLANANNLVEKPRLMKSVWNGVYVDDAVLTRAVSDIRKALGQTEGTVWIETVPKFGYRFLGEVRSLRAAAAQPPAADAPGGSGRWVWLSAIVLAGLAVGAIGWSRAHSAAPIHRLVVMPFQPLQSGPPLDSLGLGVADALITRLSNIEGLIVRPLSAVRRYERQPDDAIRAARELDADAVLEGTLQAVDDTVRVGVRLLRANDGKALWAGTLESSASRLFALEDAVAEQVAAKLPVGLTADERRALAMRPERNPEAYRLYADGRYEWGKRTREGFEKGAEYFRQAIRSDPGYARAYAGLADCYLLLGAYGYRPQLEMLPMAKTAALRALELDSRLAEAHATLGLIAQNLDWDWPETERQYREAIRIAPRYSTAHHWYAEFLSILGRFEESRKEFARAREIDPISPIIEADEAQLEFFERQYGRAGARLAKLARDNPSFALAHERSAVLHMVQGREDDAWHEAMLLPGCDQPEGDCRLTWTAWLPRKTGSPRVLASGSTVSGPAGAAVSGAAAALEKLEAGAAAGRVPPYVVLFAHIRQGHVEQALDWLQRLVDQHGVWLITAKVNPVFDPLRGEARFRAILGRLSLQ